MSNNIEPAFSFDAETDGLWGKPFAIGAMTYDPDGNETSRFAARLPDGVVSNPWVIENVLPTLEGMDVTHGTYRDMLGDFAEYYKARRIGHQVIVHMGTPVESNMLHDMHEKGMIGDFDGPYPLLDIAGHLQMAGEDPTSVDAYAEPHGLDNPDDEWVQENGLYVRREGFAGGTHNPLYDSEVTYRVWRHLMMRRGELVVDLASKS